jgi:ankyrin repeat protein
VKIAIVVGWILLVIEAVFVVTMFVSPNVGDDAAGRGMARGFGLVLGPILIGAGLLFVWGQRGGPRVAFWAGLGAIGIPLIFIATTSAGRTIGRLDRAAGRARYGKFDDARLTRLARAIEKNDTAAVRAIIAQGPIDFKARSRRGRTILGRAVEHAAAYTTPPEALESVRLLLAAGGKPEPNVIEPEFTRADLDAHLLVARVFADNYTNTLPLLDMLLEAGADPNTRNYEGQPLYFAAYMSVPKLELLAKHGADFTALETTREDRAGYTAAMSAAEMGAWEIVRFMLDHGVNARHVAPDGNSLRKILKRKLDEGEPKDTLSALLQRTN